VLKIDGKNKTLQLGTGASTPAGEAFLNCLITGRVVKVERSGSTAKLLMLDATNVADHVREFLQTKTATDPCALGHQAYAQPLPPAKAVAGATAAAESPSVVEPSSSTRAEGKKKIGRRAPAANVIRDDERVKVLGQAVPRGTSGTTAARTPAAAPAPASGAAVMQTLPVAPVEKPTPAATPTAPPQGQPVTSTSPQ
jgi:hypothetical protein